MSRKLTLAAVYEQKAGHEIRLVFDDGARSSITLNPGADSQDVAEALEGLITDILTAPAPSDVLTYSRDEGAPVCPVCDKVLLLSDRVASREGVTHKGSCTACFKVYTVRVTYD